jgi:hypothetical protein
MITLQTSIDAIIPSNTLDLQTTLISKQWDSQNIGRSSAQHRQAAGARVEGLSIFLQLCKFARYFDVFCWNKAFTETFEGNRYAHLRPFPHAYRHGHSEVEYQKF